MDRINCTLVARDIRRGWLAHGSSAEDVGRMLKRFGFSKVLKATEVVVRDPPRIPGGKLVIVSRTDEAFGRVQTHKGVAELLGLPCGARNAWDEPGMCTWVSVWVVPVDACREKQGKDVYVTSFWCRDRRESEAWIRDFKRRARAYESDVLRPVGTRFLFRMTVEA